MGVSIAPAGMHRTALPLDLETWLKVQQYGRVKNAQVAYLGHKHRRDPNRLSAMPINPTPPPDRRPRKPMRSAEGPDEFSDDADSSSGGADGLLRDRVADLIRELAPDVADDLIDDLGESPITSEFDEIDVLWQASDKQAAKLHKQLAELIRALLPDVGDDQTKDLEFLTGATLHKAVQESGRMDEFTGLVARYLGARKDGPDFRQAGRPVAAAVCPPTRRRRRPGGWPGRRGRRLPRGRDRGRDTRLLVARIELGRRHRGTAEELHAPPRSKTKPSCGSRSTHGRSRPT